MVKKIIKYILLFFLTVLIMWFAVRKQDLKSVLNSLRNLDYFWIILSAGIAALSQYVRAYRWKMQLHAAEEPGPFWKVYHAMMVGNLANVVTPQLGEVIRCTVLNRTGNIPVKVSLGTVVTEHLIDLVILLGLLGGVLLLEFTTFYTFLNKFFVNYFNFKPTWDDFLLTFGVSGLVLLLISFLIYKNIERLKHRAVFKVVLTSIRGFLAGFLSVKHINNKSSFLVVTVVTWVFFTLKGYVAFFAFTETSHLGFMPALAVLIFGSLAMWAPVQGGFGVFHLLVQGTMVLYGISSETGLLYALCIHGAWTLQIILMGGISLLISLRQMASNNNLEAHEVQPV